MNTMPVELPDEARERFAALSEKLWDRRNELSSQEFAAQAHEAFKSAYAPHIARVARKLARDELKKKQESRIPPPGSDPIIPKRDVEAIVGLSGPTIWREQRAGRFPKYDRISAMRSGLLTSRLKAWQAGRRDWNNEEG